jgi:hypothetical protein
MSVSGVGAVLRAVSAEESSGLTVSLLAEVGVGRDHQREPIHGLEALES